MEEKKMEDEDLFKVAIYFNDEYIGEAKTFKFEKGDGIKGTMNILKIKGDFQYSK